MDSSGVLKPRLSGFHFDEMAKHLKSKALKLVDITRDDSSGVYKGVIRPRNNARPLKKSFFPAEWSPKKVAENIIEALGNLNAVDSSGNRFVLTGFTSGGMELRFVVGLDGHLVTTYPFFSG